MSNLEDRLQGPGSVPWIPDAQKAASYRAQGKDCNSDETLIGVVVDHFTRDNFNGDGKIDVIVLALDGGGEVAIHCSATVLANQMRSAAPAFGERIGVKYLGVRTGSGPKPYHDFKVVTDRRQGGQIHWAGQPDPVADYVDPPRQEIRHEPTPQGSAMLDDGSDIPF